MSLSLQFQVANWLSSFSYQGKRFVTGQNYTADSEAHFEELLSQRDEDSRPYLVKAKDLAEEAKAVKEAKKEKEPVRSTGKPFVLNDNSGKDLGTLAGETNAADAAQANAFKMAKAKEDKALGLMGSGEVSPANAVKV